MKTVLAVNLGTGSLHVEIPYGEALGRNFTLPYVSEDEKVLYHVALTYSQHHPEMRLVNSRCNSKVIIETSGVTHAGVAVKGGKNDTFLDHLYLNTSTLGVDVYVGCCNKDDDMLAWNKHKDSLLSMINEVSKSVSGTVVTEGDRPIVGARISYDRSLHVVESCGNGGFWMLFSPGEHELTVEADGFFEEKRRINATYNGNKMKLTFKLDRNRSVIGRTFLVVFLGRFLTSVIFNKFERL